MFSLPDLIHQGGAHAWFFIPGAILLGALHGLEPGHSKTMMAAFIIAIRGTVGQAVMLGLAATLSHTAVVWGVALGGMYFGSHWNAETSEPYFQVASAALIISVGIWMLWRTWREQQGERRHHAHHHHGHGHHHHHDHHQAHDYHHDEEALEEVTGYQDAHERAHAAAIERRFADRAVTNWQIILFGLTGGLIPCPAAITVLLLCLQLKKFTLGVTLVLCFSIGLALTLVASGTLAALSVRHASRKWPAFAALARRAPYFSNALIICIGLYVGTQGAMTLFGS